MTQIDMPAVAQKKRELTNFKRRLKKNNHSHQRPIIKSITPQNAAIFLLLVDLQEKPERRSGYHRQLKA